ncbi:MAG TPA: hypothetical protein VK991_11855 [Halomonas sp.]|nr:hypothetical protein [Halomonas sp.]
MRRLVSIILAAALIAPAFWATAQASGSDTLASLSSRFLNGYDSHDGRQIVLQISDALKPLNPEPSAFPPTARVSPLAMAMLALENTEGQRDRVRYRITYGIEQVPNPPKYSPLPLSFIQIDRFSLGAAIRQSLIDAYGAEHVAPPEAFDAGPHVSWRLITRPVQGARADILAAGRAELSDAQAQEMPCLNGPCLSLDMELERAAPWGELQEVPLTLDAPYPVMHSGQLTPAAAIEQLTGSDRLSDTGPVRETPGLPEPLLEAVIDINLAQDSALDARMRRGGLMDDSVAAIWKRLVAIPPGANAEIPKGYQAKIYECRRGPQFPPDGGLCP